MSAHRLSWAAAFVALAWVAASSGCGSSPADTPLVSGGGMPADAAMDLRAGEAGASADASVEMGIVRSDGSSSDGGVSESSAADVVAPGEASAGLDAMTNAVDAAPGDTRDAGSTVEAGAMSDAGDTGTGVPTFACDGPGSRYVTDVVSFMFGPGQNFGQNTFPANLLGPPKGSGSGVGSLDVVSLGSGGSVTLAFAGNEIVDGPGPDFIVFENAFDVANDPTNPFAELGIVEVSQDGVQWYAFPCTATQYPYGTCAGWHPVFANPDQNTIDPTDPATAGGDPFDLADLGLTWARYVRVTDRPDDSNVFDLDAVAIVHPRCP